MIFVIGMTGMSVNSLTSEVQITLFGRGRI